MANVMNVTYIERLQARIAALEAQVAALAGALDHAHDAMVQCPECSPAEAYRAEAALTADATHLAALDAARREVCAKADKLSEWNPFAPGEVEQWDSLLEALDALAKLEGAPQ